MKFCQSLQQTVVLSWQKDILAPQRAQLVPRIPSKDIPDLCGCLGCHSVWVCRTFANLGVGEEAVRRRVKKKKEEAGSKREEKQVSKTCVRRDQSVVGAPLIYSP